MTHQYVATVVRVVDGDTVILDVDLGFGIWLRKQSFRLLGVNARERATEGGAAAAAHLASVLTVGTILSVTSVKDDKYGGRYNAHLTLADGRNLTQYLIQTGWAAAWNGSGAKPLPPWPRTGA